MIAQPLVVQHKRSDFFRELLALPPAFLTTGLLALTFWNCCLDGLNCVSCRAQFVGRDMRNHRRLSSSIRGIARRAAQIPGRVIRRAGRRAGLRHHNLSIGPCTGVLNSLSWPNVFRLYFLKEMQHMFRTRGSP